MKNRNHNRNTKIKMSIQQLKNIINYKMNITTKETLKTKKKNC